MKRLLAVLTGSISTLLLPAMAFAQAAGNNGNDFGIRVPEGSPIIDPNTGPGAVISFIIGFIIVIAFILALFFIVLGGIQWITSGGDKGKVDAARNHIIAAVIGLIIVALSFVIINVVLSALGLGSLTNLHLQPLSCYTTPNGAGCIK